MATDDLDAPLGQAPEKKRRFALPIAPLQAIAGALGCVVLIFMLWVAFADDPMGGEPIAVVSTSSQPGPEAKKPSEPALAANPAAPAPGRTEGQPPVVQPAAKPAGQTITIIDGTSGKREEITIPTPGAAKRGAAIDERFLEKSRHGMIPKIAADGARPSEAYARPLKTAEGSNPDGPRVALVVGGLGIGASGTNDALAKLPPQVTLAFAPYAQDLENLASRARGNGHEVLMQVPMEPFDYPDNDPGPQTLLTSLAADQNIDRLHWLLSRTQGYVGITNFMGARFTATEQAIAPILREVAKRGLIYIDDGRSPRSLAGQMAGANNLPFAKAEVVLDSVPTPADIDRALSRLEAMARERGVAVGTASASPATIDRISKWAKAAAARGIVLVPISAVAVKAKSS